MGGSKTFAYAVVREYPVGPYKSGRTGTVIESLWSTYGDAVERAEFLTEGPARLDLNLAGTRFRIDEIPLDGMPVTSTQTPKFRTLGLIRGVKAKVESA